MDHSKKILLEICTDSAANALIAEQAGANRIELCANLSEGGVTPSHGQIVFARKHLKIQLFVLIRPRSGDFLYSDEEFEIMEEDVRFCGQSGCNGVVAGLLNTDGTVDKQRTSRIVDLARSFGMSVTFHRAFDRSENLFQALEDIIETGCERILTSGGYNTAPEGVFVIKNLIERAGNRIIIMPGSGITPENAEQLAISTGLTEIHGSFRSPVSSRMQYLNHRFSGDKNEYSLLTTDSDKIKATKAALINAFHFTNPDSAD